MPLVLTLKRGRSVTIGDNVRVRLLEMRGDGVRLLIDAPRDISILRDDAVNREPITGSVTEDDYKDCRGGHTGSV